MNKDKLIRRVSAKLDMTHVDVKAVLESIFDTISDEVSRGDRVTIVGFGSFFRLFRSARKGVNPNTGKPLDLLDTYTPSFLAGSLFKKKVKR